MKAFWEDKARWHEVGASEPRVGMVLAIADKLPQNRYGTRHDDSKEPGRRLIVIELIDDGYHNFLAAEVGRLWAQPIELGPQYPTQYQLLDKREVGAIRQEVAEEVRLLRCALEGLLGLEKTI